MGIRKILLPLTGDAADEPALAAAFGVATAHGALVDGVYLRFDQTFDRLSIRDRMPADLFDEVATLIAAADVEDAPAQRRFEERAARGQGRWLGTRPAQRIIRDARLADLAVVGRSPAEDRPLDALRGALLATSGRPLLFAPALPAGEVAGRVLVAWNGGANATRAVAAALPLLAAARSVHVVTVKTAKSRSGEAERLRDYLALHGVAAAAEVLRGPEDEAVGAGLLRRARELEVGLLVMGGTGQLRLANLLFGNVTSHMFAHAHLPVLLAQ
jgi:nucleotide-binding universal stress UspA family protein